MDTISTQNQWGDLLGELENLQEIARFLRPSSGQIPRLRGVEICGREVPMNGILGGDHIVYIDFNRRYDLAARIEAAETGGRPEVARRLRLTKNRAGILVADVAGHRMTDAVVAAMLHQAFLLGVYYELDLFGEITTRLFEHLNTRFHETSMINKYFTMIYGEISSEGKFRFISAGHRGPLVFSREFGRFMPISADRLVSYQPVGMLPSSDDPDEKRHPSLYGYKRRYEVNEINLLAAGDILLLCTDGLSEHADGRYAAERLEGFLADVRDEGAEEICSRLWQDLVQWGAPTDDISYVVIRKLPQRS